MYGLMFVQSGYRWRVGRCYVEEVSFHVKDPWSHENHDTCNYFMLMESCFSAVFKSSEAINLYL